MRSLPAVAILLVSLLAGCAGEDAAPAEAEGAGEAVLATGGLRGIVVDAAVRPVAGAVVTVARDAHDVAVLTTDADGAWGVRDLEAGTHTVTVEKQGFLRRVANATVVAGEQVPDLVELTLEPAPVDTSHILPIPWDGVVGCAMGANWCAVIDLYTGVKVTNDASGKQFYDEFTALQRTPEFVQIEVVWEPSSPLATHMSMKVWSGNWEQWETFGSETYYGLYSYQESPMTVSLNATQLEEGLVGTETGIGLGLYAGCVPWPGCWTETGPPEAMVNQPFEAFLHAFYDCLPPEGWTFVADGAPECA